MIIFKAAQFFFVASSSLLSCLCAAAEGPNPVFLEVQQTVSDVARIPYITGARVAGVHRNKQGNVVSLEVEIDSLIRDYPVNEEDLSTIPRKLTSTSLQSFNVHGAKIKRMFKGPQRIIDSQQKFRYYSPNRHWTVVGLSRTDGGSSSAKPCLQIWQGERFLGEVDMSAIHGELCTDDFFGWIAWDEDKGLFIYQAEQKTADPDHRKLSSYVYSPNFGENLTTRYKPSIFVFDLKAKRAIQHLYPTDRFTPSQIIRTNESDVLYFIGLEVIPAKRYGICFCPNRPTYLYRWEYGSVNSEPVNLTANAPYDNAKAINYPVYLPRTKQISFFGTYLGGSHEHTHSLYGYSLIDGSVDLLQDGDKMVTGIFPVSNPQVTVPLANGSVMFTTYKRAHVALMSYDLDGILRSVNASKRPELQTWKILQVYGDIILAAMTSRITPPYLVIGIWDSKTGNINWHNVESDLPTMPLTQTVIAISDTVDVILSQPDGSVAEKTPLILIPHGGPNSNYDVGWWLFGEIANKLGFATATINYTGSAGYGQKAIKALEGKIGSLDVNDCLGAANMLVSQYSYDPNMLYLHGGSHGGFLVTHLSTYTDVFNWRAVAPLSALIDLPDMAITSDIPDFSFGQMGMSFDLYKPQPASPDQLVAMHNASPTSRVHLVKAPTLILIGEQDLRVPPYQGRAWYTWLTARGVEAKLLSFPNTGHSIDSPDGEWHELIAIFEFFKTH